jgi:hypothetical protein
MERESMHRRRMGDRPLKARIDVDLGCVAPPTGPAATTDRTTTTPTRRSQGPGIPWRPPMPDPDPGSSREARRRWRRPFVRPAGAPATDRWEATDRVVPITGLGAGPRGAAAPEFPRGGARGSLPLESSLPQVRRPPRPPSLGARPAAPRPSAARQETHRPQPRDPGHDHADCANADAGIPIDADHLAPAGDRGLLVVGRGLRPDSGVLKGRPRRRLPQGPSPPGDGAPRSNVGGRRPALRRPWPWACAACDAGRSTGRARLRP